MSKSTAGDAAKQRVPIRAIIMIVVAMAIAFLALGWHGFLTRNDSDNAALLAQQAKLSERAAAGPAAAATPVCLVAVGDPESKQSTAAEKDVRAKLTGGKITAADKTEVWPGGRTAPKAPKAVTVYSVSGQDAAADAAAAALGAKVMDRPEGLTACADSVTVVVP